MRFRRILIILLLFALPFAGRISHATITSGGTLNADEVMVDTFAELKKVLCDDSSYDKIATVYMGGNIRFESIGSNFGVAEIRAAHPDITIVGHPKDRPDLRYTIQDYPGSHIRLGKNGRTMTLKDMDIRGYNYYGTISCTDQYGTLVFDNVNYIGSQPAHNTKVGGVTVFRNSNITIGDIPTNPAFPNPPSQDARQEVAETESVIFDGNSSFRKSNGETVMFLMTNSGNSAGFVTVMPNARVSITNSWTGAYYGVAFGIQTPGNGPPLTIGNDASLSIDVNNNVGSGGYNRFGSVVIGDGAALSIVQRSNNHASAHILNTNNGLTVGRGATLDIRKEKDGGSAALINVANPSKSIVFNSPKRVNLFAANKHIFSVDSGQVTVSGTCGAINVWQSGGNTDSATNTPDYFWNKGDGTDLSFSAAVEQNRTASASLSNFNVHDDLSKKTFAADTFAAANTRRLTMGSYSLTLDPVYTSNTVITGTGEQGADIKASFTDSAGKPFDRSTAVASDGTWSVNIPTGSLRERVDVIADGHLDFLHYRARTEALRPPGELTFVSVPVGLRFRSISLPSAVTMVEREDAAWAIRVKDDRTAATPWKLTAAIATPLAAQSGGQQLVLNNVLVFADSAGNITPLGNVPLTVFSDSVGGGGETEIKWASDKGILLRLNPGQAKSGIEYATTINWSLTNAP